MCNDADLRPRVCPAVLPPRPLLACAILLVAGLGWSVASLPPPAASLAEAARWEGQTAAFEGWATQVKGDAEGSRFTLVDGTHALAVRVGATLGDSVVAGDVVQVAGRVSRWQGQLRLDVADATEVRVVAGGAAPTMAWSDLTADPQAAEGRPILLRGLVDDGRLRDGPRSIALGDGPWPDSGFVQARGLVRWDAGCLCHRLDAREVWPWTP